MGIAVAIIVLVLALGWLGLQVRPAPFADFPEASQPAETVPLPNGLPAPVERYYRLAYGDAVPVVHSVVITGRAKMRPFGVWLPARYRFTHDAGNGYRHYIEATWFRIPVMKVNERYVDGKALMELPWMKDDGEQLDQAANIGMWAELAASAPSVFLTDPRVRWRAVDDETAILVVPLGKRCDRHLRGALRSCERPDRLARGDALPRLPEPGEGAVGRGIRGGLGAHRRRRRAGDRHGHVARPRQALGVVHRRGHPRQRRRGRVPEGARALTRPPRARAARRPRPREGAPTRR